ncbi:hypothetical protein [Candidatus Laterigemmans baculatus]|uniref:hypothetical protein n=1 Tax=Candidatus Laterigemmans baculatus TaxID=2770505 RepID=UPI0013DC43C3|nr:hypothetical protein [Candidatus Laterigemmans baculatus]
MLDCLTSRGLVGGMALALAAILSTGCGGDTSGRLPLAGQVTLDGQPLDRGTIEFHPEAGAAGMTGGVITDGRFEIPAEQGVMPGTYTVRVYSAATDGTTEAAPAAPGPEAAQEQLAAERIPSRYNVDSELETTISDANSEQLEFALES